jgi:hypothetical protein
VDEADASTTKKEMTELAFLVFSESKSCPEVLAHPVAQTFLDLKWAKMKKAFFIYNGIRASVSAWYIFLAMQIYFYDCPHHAVGKKSLYQGPKLVNGSQPEDLMTVDCKWSLWTLVPLPFLLFFLSLFLILEIVKADKVRKSVNKFLRNNSTYRRISTRMLCFLLAIGTIIPPWFQRNLLAFQYLQAAVCVSFSTIITEIRKFKHTFIRLVCCLERF